MKMNEVNKNRIRTIEEILKRVNALTDGVDIRDDWFEDIFTFTIRWGDWKHQHAAAKYFINEAFKDDKTYEDISYRVTEEDGSDAYSAEYFVNFQKERTEPVVIEVQEQ